MLVLSTYLFGILPYRNCIINGIVLAEDSKKISKRIKNYPDPSRIIDLYGVDALRLYLINSPAVRAESLRFKESRVKEIVGKVLLPLWNSYKFLEGQVALLKKTEGIDFVFTRQSETDASEMNIIDVWIRAKCQSLLKNIQHEMGEYRLHSLVPQLVTHIGNITNWYIRFNRDRLKGSGGFQDTIQALTTLFDVLYTLVCALAPFAPFLTDNIYCRLLPYISPTFRGEDARSVHFLAFPSVQEVHFNEAIERRVKRMQTVIELGRVSRERRGFGLKSPLKSLVVIHSDPLYIEDVRSLEEYIARELNVHHITATSDEVKYNIYYSVTAGWPVLGKKLKKDAKRVRDSLPLLSSDQVRQMVRDKSISVDGVRLDSTDLIVRRKLKESNVTTLETNTDGDMLLILDFESNRELKLEGLARETINRMQRLRKKAGLKVTDEVGMQYQILTEVEQTPIREMFGVYSSTMEKALRGPVQENDGESALDSSLILEEDQEIQGATFRRRICEL